MDGSIYLPLSSLARDARNSENDDRVLKAAASGAELNLVARGLVWSRYFIASIILEVGKVKKRVLLCFYCERMRFCLGKCESGIFEISVGIW